MPGTEVNFCTNSGRVFLYSCSLLNTGAGERRKAASCSGLRTEAAAHLLFGVLKIKK